MLPQSQPRQKRKWTRRVWPTTDDGPRRGRRVGSSLNSEPAEATSPQEPTLATSSAVELNMTSNQPVPDVMVISSPQQPDPTLKATGKDSQKPKRKPARRLEPSPEGGLHQGRQLGATSTIKPAIAPPSQDPYTNRTKNKQQRTEAASMTPDEQEEEILVVSSPQQLAAQTSLPSHTNGYLSSTKNPSDAEIIEEYMFSSEQEASDDDMNGADDLGSHISLSSDDPPSSQSIDTRPWLSMDHAQRLEYEGMFVNVTHPAVGQSWSYTEEYQMQIDNLLPLYMQDYPLPTWVIGQVAAERAFHQYRERVRWRQLGIRIYGADRMPDLFQPRVSYSGASSATPVVPQGTNSNDATPPAVSQYPAAQPIVPVVAAVVDGPPGTTIGQPTSVAKDDDKPLSSPVHSDAPKQTHAHPCRARGHQTGSKPAAKMNKKGKDATMDTPPPHPVTPPYPTRERPQERKAASKSSKKPVRKPVEPELFAWNRDIDFRAAAEAAAWRDDFYNPETLKIMAEVRKHNEPIIERLDNEVTEKQRIARNARKKSLLSSGGPAEALARPGRKKKDPNDKSENNDPYHAGSFAFAAPEMEARALKLGYSTPDAVILAGETNKLTLEVLESIKICWNPGRKATTYELVQAPFSARDTVLTRKQLASTLILNRRAAECIIDFSPDLLWRDILLRICSETGCGNKDVRERFCLNGCHTDKATFTKRISAALGQKQMQGKAKGYGPGEWDFYEANGEDFKNYIEFFGRRSTTRNMYLKRRITGSVADSSGLDDDEMRLSAEVSIAPSDDITMDDTYDDISDAGSAQGSDALDMLSD